MDNQIKYTSDGKKVVVVGNLNSQEKIVQEIFVVDGKEIPSGEQFVVKSLHDAPVISWKEKNLKELEDRYEDDRKRYSDLISKQTKKYREQSTILEEKLKYVGKALKNADGDSFETLVNYIAGKITHVVVMHYSTPKIETFEDFSQLYEGKLRLISLFGKDEGSFTYAVGDYYDFSGGNKKFYPFTNYENAFEKFKELLLKTISEENLKIAEKYGIKYPTEMIKEFQNKRMAEMGKHIEYNKKEIEKYKNKIEELKRL